MTPKQEVETLMNRAVGFAKVMLSDHGEFHPYGAYLTQGGAIVDVGVETKSEHPPVREVLEALKEGLSRRATSGELRASALVFDVRIEPRGEASDAIQVNLEHVSGYCAEVFFPYRRHDAGHVEYFSIFAQRGTQQIFARISG